MGYAELGIVMESRTGSVSSGRGYSPGSRGPISKSSPFCPPSTSKLTQSIIKDHMVSHYKKVYSAKAAIDTSVPKSLIHSVKYNDQIRQDRLRKGDRPRSVHSLSHRTRTSCSSAQSRLSVQYDDSPYLCSRNSLVSSPRFSTSFHAKEIVYPSCKVRSKSHSHHPCPASEMMYRSTEAVLHRKQSACSLAASGDQSYFKTFQDPVQKTYSGDLLQKHSQHFTQDQPFTPKTLKSNKTSYLSKYRYYRAPQRKPTQDPTDPELTLQETFYGSTKTKEYSQEFDEPTRGFSTELEWSEDQLNDTYLSASGQQSRVNKGRNQFLFDSSSRVSPEGRKSPVMIVSAEEEELMYLEFISAVTEDILSRGHISDRVLERVMNHHIDINQDQLDEGKMRHLLEVLRKDFQEPSNMSTSSTELENKESDLLDALIPHLESKEKQMKTKENNDLLPYASVIKYCDTPEYSDVLSAFTTLHSPERTVSATKANEKDEQGDDREKQTFQVSDHLTNNAVTSQEEIDQNQIGSTATDKEITNESHKYTDVTNDKGFHQNKTEVSYDGQPKELEALGRSLSESLHVSNNTDCNNAEPASDQHTNTAASVSGDEF